MRTENRLKRLEEDFAALSAQAPQRDYSGWSKEAMVQEILARVEANPELYVIVAAHLPEQENKAIGEAEADLLTR
jgi:hypothetical protein